MWKRHRDDKQTHEREERAGERTARAQLPELHTDRRGGGRAPEQGVGRSHKDNELDPCRSPGTAVSPRRVRDLHRTRGFTEEHGSVFLGLW